MSDRIGQMMGSRAASEEMRYMKQEVSLARLRSFLLKSDRLSATDRAELEALSAKASLSDSVVVRTRGAGASFNRCGTARGPSVILDGPKAYSLGTSVSLGRGKWAVPGGEGSVFSLSTAAAMAAGDAPTVIEAARIARDSRVAAAQQPVVFRGLRVVPELTAGRAVLWGTILAVWGTSMLVVGVCKALDIRSMYDVRDRSRRYLAPVTDSARAALRPWGDALARAHAESTTIKGARSRP